MSARHLRNKPEDEDAAQLKFGPEFSGATQEACLMTSEVKFLLEQHDQGSSNPIYKKTLQYVNDFSRFKEYDTTSQVRLIYGGVEGLNPFEIVQLANLVPSSYEEAKALIPSTKYQQLHRPFYSLSSKNEDELEAAIRQVVQIRKYQG
ncbi:BQ5605_C021g09390 [Microbotryum silenes-dioicae]|uniref:BQ5605_C021g09390 protein n=1 Tax=Microbotryum silenes-dioicae TaxID=796604 RepID=A0A2X0MKH6_9BASI|nr:BQ5605_C021g09390 [Microbotryum silenes-dioicae]